MLLSLNALYKCVYVCFVFSSLSSLCLYSYCMMYGGP